MAAAWAALGLNPAGVLHIVDDVEWGGKQLSDIWPLVRVALQTEALKLRVTPAVPPAARVWQ